MADEDLVDWLADAVLATIRESYKRAGLPTNGAPVQSDDPWAFIHNRSVLNRVYQHVGSPRATPDDKKTNGQRFFLQRSDDAQRSILGRAIALLQQRGLLYVSELTDVTEVPTALGPAPRLTVYYRYELTSPLDAIVRGMDDPNGPVKHPL